MKNCICLICCALLAAGCGESRTENEVAEQPAAIIERPVEPVDQTRSLTFSGVVEAAETAHITSGVSGSVLQCNVQVGDRVASESVLFEIESNEAQIAKTAMNKAKEEGIPFRKELQRMKPLVRDGTVSSEQFKEVESSYRRTRDAYDEAHARLAGYTIRAPWSGKVSKVFVTEGTHLIPQMPLVELYEPDSLLVRLVVPEQQISLIEVGMPVLVELNGFPGQIFHAKVSRIYPELNRTKQTAMVDVVLNDINGLLLGMSARASIQVGEL